MSPLKIYHPGKERNSHCCLVVLMASGEMDIGLQTLGWGRVEEVSVDQLQKLKREWLYPLFWSYLLVKSSLFIFL